MISCFAGLMLNSWTMLSLAAIIILLTVVFFRWHFGLVFLQIQAGAVFLQRKMAREESL